MNRTLFAPACASFLCVAVLALAGCKGTLDTTGDGAVTDAGFALDGSGTDAGGADAPGDATIQVDAGPCVATDPGVAPPHGTYFTPITAPTPMFVEPAADAPLLCTVINADLDLIATSEYHEFFIRDGVLIALGGNRAGEMGIGNAIPSTNLTPLPVALPSPVRIADVSAGGYQSVAADTDGYLWAWGSNKYGARGNGAPATAQELMNMIPDVDGVPVKLTEDSNAASIGGPSDPIVQVLSVLMYSAALSTNGKVYTWGFQGDDAAGSDSRGIAGDGTAFGPAVCPTADVESSCFLRRPHLVVFPDGTQIRRIAASSRLMIGIDQVGAVWTWGSNGTGLGAGPTAATNSAPVRLTQGRAADGAELTALPVFVDAAANITNSLLLDANGDVWGWGRNVGISVGSPTDFRPQYYPVKLTRAGNAHFAELDALLLSGHAITDVQCSNSTTHVLIDDGTLWGWGDSSMGEVGDGHVVNYLTVMPDGAGHNIVRDAWDWGATTSIVADATLVLSHVESFATSAYSFHVMAKRTDGTLYSWGRNTNGVLGNQLNSADRTTSSYAPYQPVSSESYTPNFYDVPIPTRVQPF